MTGPPPLPVLVTDAMAEFSGAGCPVCRYVREAEERFFTWFAVENGVDPTMIASLQASGGMCPQHTRWMLSQPAADTRLTTVYRYVLPVQRARLAGGEPTPRNCPACRSVRQATDAALDSLAWVLTDEPAAARYAASDGVCLPHLRDARQAKPRVLVLLARTAAARLSQGKGVLAMLAGVDHDAGQRVRLRALVPHGGALAETEADPADTMSRLRARLQAGTCPVCLVEGQYERRYLTWLAGEVDRDAAGLANEPGGLCLRHLHDLAAAEPAAGGWALGRERARWAGRLGDALVGSRRGVRDKLRAVLDDDACLVCRAVADAVRGETAMLLAALATPAVRAAYEQTGGLCLRHAVVLPATGTVAALVRDVALARADLLAAELDEAARKTAWLSRHEGKGPESTAWVRAAALIDGQVFLGGPARTGDGSDREPDPAAAP